MNIEMTWNTKREHYEEKSYCAVQKTFDKR